MKDLHGIEVKNIIFSNEAPTLNMVDVGNFNFKCLNNIELNLNVDKERKNINFNNNFVFLRADIGSGPNEDVFKEILENLHNIKVNISFSNRKSKEIIYKFTYFDKSVLQHDLSEIMSLLINSENSLNLYYLCLFRFESLFYFAFKPSFMSSVINMTQFSTLPTNFTSNFAKERLSKYFGIRLTKIFDNVPDAKNRFNMIAHDLIGFDPLLSEFLSKSGFIIKSCLIDEDFKIKESISFPAFKFEEVIKENRDNSKLRLMFSNARYLFFAFARKNSFVLKTVVEYRMPLNILDNEIKKVWEETKNIINQGDIVKSISKDKNGKYKFLTNFPSMKSNLYCHVRPHGRNSLDTFPLPYPDKLTGQTNFTKQCFWLSASYVSEIIKNGI